MLTSVILHTYASIRQKLHYLFFLSGCLFIFAGLASLTALIVFIAAVNGAVDNKSTTVRSKDDESPFVYNYGYSFFLAVGSFLMQEFNGICNIYWYVDYHRKYKASETRAQNSKFPVIPQVIKLSDIDKRTDQKPGIRIVNDSDETTRLTVPPSHNMVKPDLKKNKIQVKDKNYLSASAKNIDESSLTESSHHCSSSSTSHLTESSSSSDSSEYQTKINTLSNRQLDENELKFKFYKLDKEMLPPAPVHSPFRTQMPISPPSNKIRIQSAKHEYKIKPNDSARNLINRAHRINKPLLIKNKSLTDAYFYLPTNYELDYKQAVMVPSEHLCAGPRRPSRINFVNHSANRRLLIQSPFDYQINLAQFSSPLKPNMQVCNHRRRDFKRTTSV